MMVTERCPERVVGGVVGAKRNREESAGGAPTLEWRVLESGVLAVKTPLNVVTVQGTRSVWFEPRKKRLVCPHGWGQYHLGIWNGPRAAEFPKSQLGQRVNARVQPACARARSCAGRCWHPMREPQATTRRSWPPRARRSCARAFTARACRARWAPTAGRSTWSRATPRACCAAATARPRTRSAPRRASGSATQRGWLLRRSSGIASRAGPWVARAAPRPRLVPRALHAGCSCGSWRRCTRRARPEGRGGAGRWLVDVRPCL